MKKMSIGACTLVVLLGMGFGCAKESAQAGGKQTVCPVMGGEINTKLFVDADGKRIYVCCGSCLTKVEKDPAKYIAQLEKNGVILDKAPAADPANPNK